MTNTGKGNMETLPIDKKNTVNSADQPRIEKPERPEVSQDVKKEIELKYGARHIIKLFVPVSICMWISIIVLNTVYRNLVTEDPWSLDEGAGVMGKERFGGTTGVVFGDMMINILIFMAIIVVMTFVMVILVAKKCFKVLIAIVAFQTALIMIFLGGLTLLDTLSSLNVAADWISIGICMWNFAVIGLVSIFYKGPQLLQRAALIVCMSLGAIHFVRMFPGYAAWILMGAMVIWDLIAVLTPCGPLRMLINKMAEHRETGEVKELPGLLYKAGVLYSLDSNRISNKKTPSDKSIVSDSTDKKSPLSQSQNTDSTQDNDEGLDDKGRIEVSTSSNQDDDRVSKSSHTHSSEKELEAPDIPDSKTSSSAATDRENDTAKTSHKADLAEEFFEEDEEETSPMLGLGDFFFYSMLVGTASFDTINKTTQVDWVSTISCFVAILVGLAVTLLIVAIVRKALPALPISVTLGIIFYFASYHLISPFSNVLAYHQIFL